MYLTNEETGCKRLKTFMSHVLRGFYTENTSSSASPHFSCSQMERSPPITVSLGHQRRFVREEGLDNLPRATPGSGVEWRAAADVGREVGSMFEEKFGDLTVSLQTGQGERGGS